MTLDAQTPIKSKRWPRILLIVSLSLNLVIIGLVVGAAMRGPLHKDRFSRMSMGLAAPIVALDEGQRDRLETIVLSQVGSKRELFRSLRRSKKQLNAAAVVTPYDPERVRAGVETHRADVLRTADILQSAMFEVLSDMTPEEHAAFVERLKSVREQRKTRNRKGR